jgi:hypothetical protein
MSRRGEEWPELGDLIEKIARRIEAGKAAEEDARLLLKVAELFRGEDRAWAARIHQQSPGQRRKGATGVDERFKLAGMVRAHKEQHGGSLRTAFRAVSKMPGVTVGEDMIKKYWQEMSPLLDTDEGNRNILLYFKRLKARGYPMEIKRKG